MKANKKITIGIVDDKATIRSLLEEFFQQEGFTVYTANDGKKAISLVEKINPHILLMDLRMPDMNGLEALCEIKKNKPEQLVIMMTAYEEEDIVEQAMKQGACAHISKPFDLYELVEIIHNTLSKTKIA